VSKFRIHEPPNVNAPLALECNLVVEQMRQTLSGLARHVVHQLDRHPMTAATRVALAGIWRVNEGVLSTQYLVVKNRVRDAVILVLNLYELQLDLQYIAIDLSRASTWLDHTKANKKPWTVAAQIRELHPIERERDAEFWWYRQLSMAKHGNPVAGIFGFPLAVTRDTLQYEVAGEGSSFLAPTLFALGCCIERAGRGASRIWNGQGIDTADFAERLAEFLKDLWKLNEKQIAMLLEAADEGSGPSGSPAPP
jgi:hypothetical protein